jgi:hypothetical protein
LLFLITDKLMADTEHEQQSAESGSDTDQRSDGHVEKPAEEEEGGEEEEEEEEEEGEPVPGTAEKRFYPSFGAVGAG